MPHFSLILFELIMLLLLAFCLRHAWQHAGWLRVWEFSSGVVFGWLLEWATIMQLSAYEYGDFVLKIGPLPLGVGIGWGVIIYTAMLFSDASSLPLWARPISDALMALNIDLAMDAIAIRLGMWDWGRSLTSEYFGVPFANFWAWFWVVFSFSLALRTLKQVSYSGWRWLAPLGAIVLGTLGVLGTNTMIVDLFIPAGLYEPSVAVIVFGALGLLVYLRPKYNLHPLDHLVFWVPFTFHIYFLIIGLVTGVILQPVILLIISIIMFVVSVYLHLDHLPFWRKNEI